MGSLGCHLMPHGEAQPLQMAEQPPPSRPLEPVRTPAGSTGSDREGLWLPGPSLPPSTQLLRRPGGLVWPPLCQAPSVLGESVEWQTSCSHRPEHEPFLSAESCHHIFNRSLNQPSSVVARVGNCAYPEPGGDFRKSSLGSESFVSGEKGGRRRGGSRGGCKVNGGSSAQGIQRGHGVPQALGSPSPARSSALGSARLPVSQSLGREGLAGHVCVRCTVFCTPRVRGALSTGKMRGSLLHRCPQGPIGVSPKRGFCDFGNLGFGKCRTLSSPQEVIRT